MEYETSSQRVFQTPELLLNILNYLEARSLRSAVRVNHHWFSCGIEVLWRFAHPIFITKAEKDRRQIYASALARLTLTSGSGLSDEERELLAELTFPKLKWLNLSAPYFDGHVQQYFSPALINLHLREAPLMPCFLEWIASRCPRLQSLLIRNSKYGSADSFIGFLRACPSVQSIYLLYNQGPDCVKSKILIYLAGRKNLRKLSTGATEEELQQVLKTVSSPFSSLKNLRLTLKSEAIPALVKCVELGHVPGLDINCPGRINEPLHGFSRLICLRSLDLVSDEAPAAVDIMALKSLTLLEHLCISSLIYDDDRYPISDFDSSHLDSLLSNLPRLTKLELSFPCDLSGSALQIVSKRCPIIERCTFYHNVDHHRLEESDIFPHLGMLGIENFVKSDIEAGDKFAQRFLTQCPQLHRLGYLGNKTDWDDQFCRACVKIIKYLDNILF